MSNKIRNCGCGMPGHSLSRREMLQSSGLGFGSLALSCLMGQDLLGGAESPHGTEQSNKISFKDLKPRPSHYAPTAKAMILLYQEGGPSQMDLFDPKPELTKHHGQPHPGGIEIFSADTNKNILMGSPFQFRRFGECGMELSEIIPHMGSVADEFCLVRSMHTEHNNHPEGNAMMLSGKTFAGRPSLGAWVSYALGTENQNLPAFIVLRDPKGYGGNTKRPWTNGWMPAMYQGIEFGSTGSPVHYLERAEAQPAGVQRNSLNLLAKLNAEHHRSYPGNSELEARIKNYELAARMQLSVTDVLDLSSETAATRAEYGLDDPITAQYGTRCLMARRLIESGVRFVQLMPPFAGWDHHGALKKGLSEVCANTDRPTAALIKDLKARGLLDSTLILWTGEFGRLPITQSNDGRDHNRHAFSVLMAGGGVKGGQTYGATDEFGYKSVDKRMSVPDLHATMLHLLGFDHTRLSYLNQGRNETLTDIAVSGAHVVGELLHSPPPA